MRRHSPVLRRVVLLRVVFLVVGEEGVELDALLEVVDCLKTADVLHEVEVAVGVDARANESVPVHALQLNVGVVLLEGEVQCLAEVDVWSLDGVHVFTRHFELGELKVLGEDFHFV
jgi:hypothetical protein